MKKLSLLCSGIWYAAILTAQPSFQTSLEAGISLPLNSNDVNATHAGKAIHFGNHLDYSFGSNKLRFGIGAYIGYINAIAVDNKYKQIGESIAEKYRFSPSALVFNSSAFKSTHILFGPIASFGSEKLRVNIWAKGGYGLNEPSKYSVVDKENGAVNNVYINQSGENKNGLAYNLGAGIACALSPYVGFKLSAGYFSTQTDQVNYNFDREKGTAPLYYTAANQFIQASAGLQFTIGNPVKGKERSRKDIGSTANGDGNPSIYRPDQKIKTKSNIKNDRLIHPDEDGTGLQETQINKSKSNVKNNLQSTDRNNGQADNDTDSLLFSPEKIELRAMIAGNTNRIQLQSVDNYLTGFLYNSPNGAVLNQCGSGAMDSDPIPGVDVHLRRLGSAGNDIMTTRTNRDGSFSFNNITPGNYTAETGTQKMDIAVAGNNDNAFKTLDIYGGTCDAVKQNYIINAGDKTYVEVIAAGTSSRGMANAKKHPANVKFTNITKITSGDAGSGLPTGQRLRKPFLTQNMQFEINADNIVSSDGKLYAEVISAREASSGMATGRVIVTGDLDGDGIAENAVVAPRDTASGMLGGRKHVANVKYNDFIVSPRDPASGLPSGKRMHKPFVITSESAVDADEQVALRDAASGLPTGRRMHKPFVITKELNAEGDETIVVRDAATGRLLPTVNKIAIDEPGVQKEIVSPRDASSGLPTGKRMHKPYVITRELDRIVVDTDEDEDDDIASRDAATGLASGKSAGREGGRTYTGGRRVSKPVVIMINPEDDTYEVVSPRDAASGLPTGKRMHKPFVITKELGYSADGNPITTYKIIHRDIAARDALLSDDTDREEKMAIKENGIQANNQHKKGIITGKDNDNGMYTDAVEEAVATNPLYEQSGSHGVNPLFEAKSGLRVMGSNGIAHDIFIPANLVIGDGNQAVDEGNEYKVGPIRWMSPESITKDAAGKSINEKGIKRAESAAGKSINTKGIKKMDAPEKAAGVATDASNLKGEDARKGWDGVVKGGSVVSDDANNASRKGWDGTVKGGSKNINTSEDNLKGKAAVKTINRVRCADGTCAIEAIVEVDGIQYEAVVTGVLKTKHDTAKNSVGNIR